jgi:hypothetical protein
MDERIYIKLNFPIFKEHPTVIFSKNMKVPVGFWNDLWRRYTFLEYKPSDLQDWFELKIGKEISEKTIRRYLIRQELFNRAQLMIRKGEETVHIRHFTKHQEYLKPYMIKIVDKV